MLLLLLLPAGPSTAPCLTHRLLTRPPARPKAGGELAYRLPHEAASAFPPLLRQLQLEGERLGVGPYGLAVTTLEEVFLKVSEAAALPAPGAPPGDGPAAPAAPKGGGGGGSPEEEEGLLLVHLPRSCYLRVSAAALLSHVPAGTGFVRCACRLGAVSLAQA